jgi:hypothetical protein
MPRVSQAETWELVASKLWGVCYPPSCRDPLPLNLREFIIFIFRELYRADRIMLRRSISSSVVDLTSGKATHRIARQAA